MFNFFGKKKEKVQAVQEKIQLSDERISELRDVIETTTAEIKEIDPADANINELLASLYEKLGLAYAELGEDDQALVSLEKSLDYKLTIGDGYKKLMSIYNAKRAEAARNGRRTEYDNRRIQYTQSGDVTGNDPSSKRNGQPNYYPNKYRYREIYRL